MRKGLLLLLLLWGCSTPPHPSTSSSEAGIPDPFEDWNRSVFVFNTVIDQLVFGPFFLVYDLFPPLVKKGLTRFLANLDEPYSMIQCLFQGDINGFFTHESRFLINSLAGLGGVMDIASQMGIPSDPQDFNKTVKKMLCLKPGFFLMVPFLGPSTARETTARCIGQYMHPVNFWWPLMMFYYPLSILQIKVLYRDAQTTFQESFDDPYSAFRSSYEEDD